MRKSLKVLFFISVSMVLLWGLGAQAATVINLDDALKQALTNPLSDAQINMIDPNVFLNKPDSNVWGTVTPTFDYIYQEYDFGFSQSKSSQLRLSANLKSWLLLKKRLAYKNLQLEDYNTTMQDTRNDYNLKLINLYLRLVMINENQKALEKINASFETYYKVLAEKADLNQLEPLLLQKAKFYKNKLQVMYNVNENNRNAVQAEIIHYLNIQDSTTTFTTQDGFEAISAKYGLVDNWNPGSIADIVANQTEVINLKNSLELYKMSKSINDFSSILPDLSYNFSINTLKNFKMSLDYAVSFDWDNLNLFNGTRVYFRADDTEKRFAVSLNYAGLNSYRNSEKENIERYTNRLNNTIFETTTRLTDLINSLKQTKASLELTAEEKAIKDAEIRQLADKLENDQAYVDLLKLIAELGELTGTYSSKMSGFLYSQFQYKMTVGN